MPAPTTGSRRRKVCLGVGVSSFVVAAAVTYGVAQGSASTGAVHLAANNGTASAGSIVTSKPAANTASAGTSSAGTSGSSQDAAKFNACMRSNGEPNFPGITVSSNGTVQLKSNGTRVDPISAQYRKAVQACESSLPAGTSLPQAPKVPAVSGPAMKFSCSGSDCPAKPKKPTLPS